MDGLDTKQFYRYERTGKCSLSLKWFCQNLSIWLKRIFIFENWKFQQKVEPITMIDIVLERCVNLNTCCININWKLYVYVHDVCLCNTQILWMQKGKKLKIYSVRKTTKCGTWAPWNEIGSRKKGRGKQWIREKKNKRREGDVEID